MAAVSGDARRALEICRLAAEVADYRAKKASLSSSDASGRLSSDIYFHVHSFPRIFSCLIESHIVFQL